MNFIKNLDSSGVPILLRHGNQTHHKSVFGGILTAIIYTISLGYTLYILSMWINGSLLPSIQTETSMQQNLTFKLKDGFINIKIQNYDGYDVDAFDQNEIIILPLLQYNQNQYEYEKIPIISEEINTISVDSITLSIQDDGTSQTESYYYIIFTRCDESLLRGIGKCASQQKIDEYFTHMPLLLTVKVNLESYNSKIQQNEVIVRSHYLVLEEELTQYTEISFKSSKQLVSNNILFDSYSEQQIVNSLTLTNQAVQRKSSHVFFHFDILLVMEFRVDRLQVIETIQYPKLGSVLAQIGSIVSVLMFAQHLSVLYNEQELNTLLINEIIQFYYPTFKEIQIKKDLLGRISSATLKNKELNLNQFKAFYAMMTDRLSAKLNYVNQLYEVSRIVLFMQQTYERDKLINTKQYNLKLPVEIANNEVNESNTVHPIGIDSRDVQHTNIIELQGTDEFDMLLFQI